MSDFEFSMINASISLIELLQREVRGHFEQEVADEEQAGPEAEDRGRQAHVLVHVDGGKAYIHAIKERDEVEQHDEGNNTP